jgi:hypothetical protein
LTAICSRRSEKEENTSSSFPPRRSQLEIHVSREKPSKNGYHIDAYSIGIIRVGAISHYYSNKKEDTRLHFFGKEERSGPK